MCSKNSIVLSPRAGIQIEEMEINPAAIEKASVKPSRVSREPKREKSGFVESASDWMDLGVFHPTDSFVTISGKQKANLASPHTTFDCDRGDLGLSSSDDAERAIIERKKAIARERGKRKGLFRRIWLCSRRRGTRKTESDPKREE